MSEQEKSVRFKSNFAFDDGKNRVFYRRHRNFIVADVILRHADEAGIKYEEVKEHAKTEKQAENRDDAASDERVPSQKKSGSG